MMRHCDICGQVDDHPRALHVTAPGDGKTRRDIAQRAIVAAVGLGCLDEVQRHLSDDSLYLVHFDCCAESGCPDSAPAGLRSCDLIVSTMPKGYVKGDKLRKHIESGAADHIGPMLQNARRGTVLVEEN